LFDELDIVGVGIEVLGDEVVAAPQRTPLGVEEEAPDLVRAVDSGAAAAAAAAWTARCEGFPLLLCLRDQINDNVRVGVRSQ
jgi:hypothetical protein